MYNTRFMSRMFSATNQGDARTTDYIGRNIENARMYGVVETSEVRYFSIDDDKVAIVDKGNGEVTIAEELANGDYDLSPSSQAELESFLHPGTDGVTPGNLEGGDEECVEMHMDGSSVISPNVEGGLLNPEAGHERRVVDIAEEKEFSVSSDNVVVQKIFSDQEFCDRIFSEVIESEETAKVGDLKVEKDPDDDNSVIVTSESTGDQARVILDGDEMEVTELDSKNFSDYYGYRYYSEDDDDECGDFSSNSAEQFDQLHVVGVDAGNHILVDAPEYDEDSANDLVDRLTEQGVQGCQIFDNAEDARDYAAELMSNLGAESDDDVDVPEQAEFSDHTIYLTKFYSNNCTDYMVRCFSEAAEGVSTSEEEITDAIESGEEINNGSEIITPINSTTAIIADMENGEYTKATLNGESLNLDEIDAQAAAELTNNIIPEADEEEYNPDYDEDEDDEREFSDVYYDESETRFFSENEVLTDYMVRLYSGDADEDDIEDAIEDDKVIETEDEIITPIGDETAIIEDKDSGEYTMAVMDDDSFDLSPITEEVAEDLIEEKEFSGIYTDDTETVFFSENELMTDYMTRLYSADADEDDIEDAIESGEQIETDDEVITPVDSTTAVIEDKENGEFTKAVMDDDSFDLTPISEDEADDLTDGLALEDEDDDEDDEEAEKQYSLSGDYVFDKFFAEAVAPAAIPPAPAPAAPMAAPVAPAAPAPVADPNAMPVDENGNPIDPAMAQGPTIETIEDKAIAAVQSIQAAAAEAEATIMNAKAAPVEAPEQNLQEAQFSYYDEDDYYDDYDERYFTDSDDDVVYDSNVYGSDDTLVSWLNGTQMYR